MKNIITITLFSAILLCSCNSKNGVEIYLTKTRLPSSEGVSLNRVKSLDTTYIKSINDIFNNNLNTLRFDNSNNRLIYSGRFQYSLNDLQSKPFIESNEIKSFDSVNCTFELKDSALKRLSDVHFNQNGFGQQFVLFANKRPILQGYIIGGFHKFPVDNNSMTFYKGIKSKYLYLSNSDNLCVDNETKSKIVESLK